MDTFKLQALWNAASLVGSLDPGEMISREELIDKLRKPVPAVGRPSDSVILHAYRHYVINAGVQGANTVVSYEEASALCGKSVEAIRQAAYRGALVKLTEYWNGCERAGVVFTSLADWCRWTHQDFTEAERLLNEMRGLDTKGI